MSCALCKKDPEPEALGGSYRECAFKWEGLLFSHANWNCKTLGIVRFLVRIYGNTVFTPEEETLGVLWTGEEFLCVQFYKNRGRTQDLKILTTDSHSVVRGDSFDSVRVSLSHFVESKILDECPDVLTCTCGAERKVRLSDTLKSELICSECGKTSKYSYHSEEQPFWVEVFC